MKSKLYLITTLLVSLVTNYTYAKPSKAVKTISKSSSKTTVYSKTTETSSGINSSTDALVEVNRVRRLRGLKPFIRDHGLTIAARRLSVRRARSLIAGHTNNDFSA